MRAQVDLAYFTFEKEGDKVFGKGPIGKFFSSEACVEIMKILQC